MQLAHHLADDARRLDMSAVRPQPHLAHLVQDAPLHGLEAVPRVRQRPRVDDRVGVFEEGPLHLGRHIDVFNALGGCGGHGFV
jgi:hypothetical protein